MNMKNKNKFWIFPLIAMGFLLILTTGCKKDETNTTPTPTPTPATVTDVDGNVYQTVTIGTQVWLKQNLKVKHYRNGDSIPNILNATTWSTCVTGACCDFENIPTYSTTFGKLYNWYAVNDSRKIAPVGWHVSTDAEWTTLKTFLGGDAVSAGKLKEVGIVHWFTPNVGASNSSGFTALPGGYRMADGAFDGSSWTKAGLWWTSTVNASEAWYYGIYYDSTNLGRADEQKGLAYSVRCVKD